MKREKLVIGLDLDGVILDSTELKIKFARQFGFDLKPEQTPAEVIGKFIPADVLDKMRKLLYESPETAVLAGLVPGAKEGVGQLKNFGRSFYLISNISRRKNPGIAKEILCRHGLWPEYFSENNAFFVLNSEEKSQKAAEVGVSIYLDDQPHVLDKLESVKEKILFDRFGCFPDSKYKTVESWQQFLDLLDIHF